jgi:CRISPR/Cas system-associated exonuclease Cas4 (RecB family)
VSSLGLRSPLRLSKDRISDRFRCQGLFQASLSGEGASFVHSVSSAAGTLLHKAIELEVGARGFVDGADLVDRAASRLFESDRGFGPFFRNLDDLGRGEVRSEAVRRVELFRASFPPLGLLRRELHPVSELWLEAEFGSGALSVVGKVDLMLGSPDPARATRVLVDFKTGAAWPEHAEDMRLYALLYLMRFGVAPLRVATFLLSSGKPQVEDVTEETLERAADRVVESARTVAELQEGQEPALSPGPHCTWCPRSDVCSESLVRPDRPGSSWEEVM